MAGRLGVVAVDVGETLFLLELLRPRLEAGGLPGRLLAAWFAPFLRGAFAPDAAGVYRNFREVAEATLAMLFGGGGPPANAARIDEIIAGFVELDAHSDVAPAMRKLRDAGIHIVTLTNGSAAVTSRLLERAGLMDRVE